MGNWYYTRGSVKIGDYSFIGAVSIVLPGVTTGKGCLVGAGAPVSKDIPDYSIVVGNPAKVVGSTKNLDKLFLDNKAVQNFYYDKAVLSELLEKSKT